MHTSQFDVSASLMGFLVLITVISAVWSDICSPVSLLKGPVSMFSVTESLHFELSSNVSSVFCLPAAGS